MCTIQVVIQRVKALVWWVADQKKCGTTPVVTNFTMEVMKQADEENFLWKELAEKELTVKYLGRFDPNDFDTYEDALLNLLNQKFGVLKKPLRYIVHPDEAPAEFASAQEERRFQLPLIGTPSNLTITQFIGNLRHSSSTLLVGHG